MGMNVNLDDGGVVDEGDGGNESVVAEINITPLTDVFLVLLIIFMVTTTAAADAEKSARDGVKVALPKANAAGPVTKRRTDPVLTITKDGKLFIGTRAVASDDATLETELRKALQEVESETLLLRGDKQVMLGSAVDVMSVAKRAGAKNIAILTQPGAAK